MTPLLLYMTPPRAVGEKNVRDKITELHTLFHNAAVERRTEVLRDAMHRPSCYSLIPSPGAPLSPSPRFTMSHGDDD